MTDDDLDERIDALYAGGPEGFTAARDALARELRAAAERGGADRVRALRRPTRLAAELNRIARRWPAGVEAVVAAQQGLAAAQRGMLGGGGPDALRDAEAEEARAVDGLTDDPALRAALRFAARSDRDRADLRRGRLSRDPTHDPGAGLFGAAAAGAPAVTPIPAAPVRAPGPDDLAGARESRDRAAREAAERRAREAAERAAAAARERARASSRAAAAREEAARQALAAARGRAEEAAAGREVAAAEVSRLRDALVDAERRLGEREGAEREAAAALTGAQERADEAVRAREEAERAVPEA